MSQGLPPTSASSSPWTFLAPAGVAALVYANTLPNGFVYDDASLIANLADWEAGRWRELTVGARWLTYQFHLLDRWLWEDWAGGFHLTNLLLHALASAVVALAALRLSRSQVTAAFCGLLFALHPVHVEAVASFTNRKDVLAMIFAGLSLVLWIGAGRAWLRYPLALLCFGAGLFSKEVAVVGLPAMLLFASLFLAPPGASGGRWRRALLLLTPFLLLGGGAAYYLGGLAEYFAPAHVLGSSDGQLENYGQVLAAAAASVPGNLRLLLFPVTLSADYPIPMGLDFRDAWPLFGVALLVLWVAASLALLRRAPLVSFALTWTLLMYLPCSNLVPVTRFFLAERYLYVPSFGVCLLFGLGADALLRRLDSAARPALRSLALVGLSAVLVGAGVRTVLRNLDWHNEVALATSSLEAGIETYRLHNNLGLMRAAEGELDEAIAHYRRALALQPRSVETHSNLGVALHARGEAEAAIRHYRQALQLRPRSVETHNNLGIVLMGRGQREAAIRHYRRALDLKPHYNDAHNNLGIALAEQGDYDGAIEHYREALRLAPGHADVHSNLGIALAGRGELDAAIRSYQEAVRLAPEHANAHSNLGIALVSLGRRAEAAEHFREALRLRPDDAEGYNNLAWLLATDPDRERREPDEAVRLAEHAVALREGRDPTSLDTLAASYAAAGRFAEAAATAERALALASGPLADSLRRDLERYRAAQPAR